MEAGGMVRHGTLPPKDPVSIDGRRFGTPCCLSCQTCFALPCLAGHLISGCSVNTQRLASRCKTHPTVDQHRRDTSWPPGSLPAAGGKSSRGVGSLLPQLSRQPDPAQACLACWPFPLAQDCQSPSVTMPKATHTMSWGNQERLRGSKKCWQSSELGPMAWRNILQKNSLPR